MRKACALLPIAGVLAICSGCVSFMSQAPGSGLPLENAKTTATYDVLGDAKGSASGGTLFGFISIGGERKSGHLGYATDKNNEVTGKTVVAGFFFPPWLLYRLTTATYYDPVEQTALYNALESVPDADMLLMPRLSVERSRYIIYTEKTVTVKGKAIRLKTSAN